MKKIFSLIFFLVICQLCYASEFLVSTDKLSYYRYEFVHVYVNKNPDELNRDSKARHKFKAYFYCNNTLVNSVDDRDSVNLKFDSNKNRWFCRWPIPQSPPLGKYKVDIKEEKMKKNAKEGKDTKAVKEEILYETVSSAEFEITGRASYILPKGFSVLTLEGEPRHYIKGFPSPYSADTKTKSWESIIDWAEFLGADALWCLVGQTHMTQPNDKSLYPWDPVSLKVMEKISKRAHEKNIQFGGWLCCFYIWGKYYDKSDYQFTTAYTPSKGLHTVKFISLKDKIRKKHIVNLMKIMDSNPNVSYIGLDYVRTSEIGGFELMDDFVKEMDVNVPQGWWMLPKDDRMIWVAERSYPGAPKFSKAVFQKWAWFKAHKVAEILCDIIKEADVKKPIWTFTLGWQEGQEHGQDPLMFNDAGVSINSIMLYHSSDEVFKGMMKGWDKYLEHGKSAFVLGEVADWNEIIGWKDNKKQGNFDTLCILDRHQEAVNTFCEHNKNLGIFWHDISRIFYGNKGPFSPLEWALTGGTSFSKLRAMRKALPFSFTLELPEEAVLNEKFKVNVSVKNDTAEVIKDVDVKLFFADSVECSKTEQNFSEINAGESQKVSFEAKIINTRSRTNKHMISCRVTFKNKKGFDLNYVKLVKEKK